jgi:hypothetical protein
MLDALLSAGFEHVTALHALGVLIGYVLGFTGAQASATPVDLHERLSELPAGDFPMLSQVAADYPAHLSDEAFDYGLELILRGLRTDLELRSRGARPAADIEHTLSRFDTREVGEQRPSRRE